MFTADFLSWLRENCNMTQQSLAEKVGISQSYLKKLESNDKPINRSLESRIVSALSLSYEQVLHLKELYREVRLTVGAR